VRPGQCRLGLIEREARAACHFSKPLIPSTLHRSLRETCHGQRSESQAALQVALLFKSSLPSSLAWRWGTSTPEAGTVIYLTMEAVFIAQATNTPLTLMQQIALLAVLDATNPHMPAHVAPSSSITFRPVLKRLPVDGEPIADDRRVADVNGPNTCNEWAELPVSVAA
jgi:hypothetical protein